MEMEQALQTFIAESRELLEDMEQALLDVGKGEDGQERINAIFRAAHTIKGSSGLFGLDRIVAFTHVVESALDRVRQGGLALDESLIAALLACRDHLGAWMDVVANTGSDEAAQLDEAGAALLAPLRDRLGGPPPAVAVDDGGNDTSPVVGEAASGDVDPWHLSLRFGANVLRDGMDPLSFLRYLARLGSIKGVVVLDDALPEAAAMEPETCYLGFEVALVSAADKAAIESVFEFVRDDLELRMLPPHSRITEYLRLIHELPEDDARLGEMLVQCGSITKVELDAALDEQAVQLAQQGAAPHQSIGEILVAQCAAPQPLVEAALARQQAVERKSQDVRSIRIDADKLDQLISQVGELITAGAGVRLVARERSDIELQERADVLAGLVEAVRDSALQLRMVRIGTAFSRFQRVVHDTAREIGKDIRLVTSGEDTELDKTVVEKIIDPLTHLVRNAIDHGIESAADRAASGKPLQGTVGLNAWHDSGAIVIEVSDDGGGLDRERILAKAIERGLVKPEAQLGDGEIFELIFEPGFSTAAAVTNLSGRGVGMDVVKRNITALRGSVGIASTAGVGTTITVRLPLTLAIIDGFQVGVGDTAFVLPLEMVDECIELEAASGHDYTNLRGQVLPFIRLRELFDIAGEPPRRENIVVLAYAGQRAGLVVDALMGEIQAVIKPMGRLFGAIKCISGSTILGSGQVALVLDVPALVERAMRQGTSRPLAKPTTMVAG